MRLGIWLQHNSFGGEKGKVRSRLSPPSILPFPSFPSTSQMAGTDKQAALALLTRPHARDDVHYIAAESALHIRPFRGKKCKHFPLFSTAQPDCYACNNVSIISQLCYAGREMVCATYGNEEEETWKIALFGIPRRSLTQYSSSAHF